MLLMSSVSVSNSRGVSITGWPLAVHDFFTVSSVSPPNSMTDASWPDMALRLNTLFTRASSSFMEKGFLM